eukprot:COSAG06_NODE_59_length_27189_cov_21.724527_20_plen_94_part_00
MKASQRKAQRAATAGGAIALADSSRGIKKKVKLTEKQRMKRSHLRPTTRGSSVSWPAGRRADVGAAGARDARALRQDSGQREALSDRSRYTSW